MKKSVIGCALAMLAVVAFVTGCEKPSLVTYAPAKTDLIGYVNLKKICANKIGQTILAREDVKAQIAKAEKETGLKIAKLLNSESAVFADTTSFKGKIPVVSALNRFYASDDMVAKIFAVVKQNDKDSKDIKVDGKPALTDQDGEIAMIELEKNLLQVGPKSGKTFVALKSGAGVALSNAVDTKALISVVYQVSDDVRQLIKKNLPMIPDDVSHITIDIRENKDRIDSEIMLKFNKPESATVAKGTLTTLRDSFKDSPQAKQYKGNLEGLKIDAMGDKLYITSSIFSDRKSVV